MGLHLANLYGAEFLGNNLLSILFVVVLLSVGAPIAPGSVMITVTTLLNTMDVPLEGLCFVIGINVIIELLLTVCSVVGDIAVTLVVARTEGLLDLNIYREKATENAAR